MPNLPDLQEWLATEFELSVVQGITMDECESMLATKINHLINHDFAKLVQILYHIDVNESKLKNLLNVHQGKEAGKLIASEIIERQMQKIMSREQSDREDKNIPEEEKW